MESGAIKTAMRANGEDGRIFPSPLSFCFSAHFSWCCSLLSENLEQPIDGLKKD